MAVKKRFHSLEKLFLTGERDSDIYGLVTDKGILYGRKLIYEKNETEEHYLSRMKFNDAQRYPTYFYAFISENEYYTQDDYIISNANLDNDQNIWQKTLEDYIDSISDDTVLIGVDCHM